MRCHNGSYQNFNLKEAAVCRPDWSPRGCRVDGIQSSRAAEGRFGFTPGYFRSASHTGNVSPLGMNLQSYPENFTTALPNNGK